MKFKKNDKVKISSIGEEATVISELGNGGQGAVYKVSLNGKEYAMKWYHKPQKQDFYNNLKNNVSKGTPNKSFLWVLYLTEKVKDNTFGYLMELRPPEYKDFGQFLLAKEHFASVSAMIEAAVKICTNFRILHGKGYSYQDLNDGNFFIDPKTGDVLICDNDNVAPSGINTGIIGKCRYMAPEIVLGNMPNTQSDRYSLSVILFLLFFGNHPLEGKQIAETPCMTEKHEKKFYGSAPVFIYDPTDDSNRPVKGIHNNVINIWKQFPEYVRTAFEKQFSKEMLANPQKRQTEKEWLTTVILRLRNDLVVCPTCGDENFANNGNFTCGKCCKTFKSPVLVAGKNIIGISSNKKIFENIINLNSENYNQISGEFVESKKTSGLFALRNLTNDTWILTKKDGSKQPVKNGEPAPLLIGNKIEFGNGNFAEIK
ncbi:MAG: protein kinase [Prevotellaceae bacterium]|jgi:serine/threonine protein kinase|nr:protein kinase [Prevotellaceae bacterium]